MTYGYLQHLHLTLECLPAHSFACDRHANNPHGPPANHVINAYL